MAAHGVPSMEDANVLMMRHSRSIGQGKWRKSAKKVALPKAGLHRPRGKRGRGREVCEKRLEVLLRPYYNLVILERKAEEANHARPGRMDRPAQLIFRRTDVWEMPGT
jgi:hypothetical protein